jgi:hypothetical protein
MTARTPRPRGPRRSAVIRGIRRSRRVTLALAGLVTSALIVTTSVSAEPTLASWLDSEWVTAQAGTLDCTPGQGQFSSRASGALLSGEVLTLDLDDVAEVSGVEVTNSGTGVTVDPPSADSQGDDAYVNPLEVTALGAINVGLGNLLALPLDTDAGVVNAYAQARDTGRSVGAAGAVNDSGAVQLAPVAPGAEPPTLASIELGRILSAITGAGLGGGIAGLADASLEVGAVASVASLDACAAEWDGSVYDNLARDYLVAALDLEVDSPLVGALVTDTTNILTGVEATVEALAGTSGLVNAITTDVSALLSGLLSGLRLGSIEVNNLAVTLNLSAVTALLDDTISDDAGIVSIDLAGGTIGVDLAGLLGSVYGSSGLNGLAPNTQLLVNAPVINALTAAVTQALENWVADLTEALSLALEVMTVSASVKINLLNVGTTPVAAITLAIPPTSLATLLDGGVAATVNINLFGAGPCVGILPVLSCLLDVVLGVIVLPLVNGIGLILGEALDAALFGTSGPGGLLSGTTATLTALLDPVIDFVGAVTASLFGEGSLLSLTVNAQNRPDPGQPSGADEPEWAADLAGPDPLTRSSGRYDVSALRLSTLGLLGDNLNVELDLARSSVGANQVVG